MDDFYDIINHWQNAVEGRHCLEGESGVRVLNEMVGVIGFRDVADFIARCPGVGDCIFDFIINSENDAWVEAFKVAGGWSDVVDDDSWDEVC